MKWMVAMQVTFEVEAEDDLEGEEIAKAIDAKVEELPKWIVETEFIDNWKVEEGEERG